MKLLLDTHSFVWWRDSPEKLSSSALNAISDSDNEIFLSVVVDWELQIKIALKKFRLNSPLKKAIEEERDTNNFGILPVQLHHVLKLAGLPSLHKDPFDRLLIAQAMAEDHIIVTVDERFSDYGIKVLW